MISINITSFFLLPLQSVSQFRRFLPAPSIYEPVGTNKVLMTVLQKLHSLRLGLCL